MKLKKVNLVLLALAFVGVLVWVICEDGVDNLLAMFRVISIPWLLCGVLFMVLYWLLEGGILHDIVKAFHPEQRFKNSLTTSMIGQLFNCITPFASGGQPVQAYDMLKSGVPLGIAGSSLMIKFIVYQFCLTIYSAVVLIFYWEPFSMKVSGFGWLVFVGFAINTAVMLGLLCICFFRRFTRSMVNGIIRVGAKLRLVKDKERALERAETELAQFHDSFAAIREHRGMVTKAGLLSLLQLTVFFLIPYFICRAFGIQGLPLLEVLSAQAFVVMISSFVPLPGAAGGAEYSFHTFFSPFFPTGVSVNLAMLLWRLITFYLPILVGMIFMLRSSKRNMEAAAAAS